MITRKLNIPPLRFPHELPIVAKKEQIIAAIKKNQVVIITGETGSGKTTQIPKMCLAAGCGSHGLIGLTQPRRIAAVTIAQRIAQEIGEECGQSISYKIRFEEKSSKKSLIKVMTDGILLAETVHDHSLRAYDTIIVDEAHERSLNIDFILGYLRTLLKTRKDLKIIITSATIDTAKFSAAFNNAPVIEVSGRMYPVEVRYSPLDPEREENGEITYIDEAINCVERLQEERRYDDILIFLPTEQDIRETCERLTKRCTGLVLPMFARLSSGQQRQVFARANQQKIIVATNIAETSLTIPGIKYVIDAGLARMLEYNPRSQITGLPVLPVSRSSADQRKGRCGRVQNGICIRLYSALDYAERHQYTTPEILRSNLASVILRLLALQLGSINDFPFIDRPQPKSIRDGIEILRDLGALVKDEDAENIDTYKLTQTGREMARFPLDPRVSRILIEAQKENCVNEIAVIAAALSIQEPRERPYEKTEQAAKAHARFQNSESDFLAYLNIWNHYHQNLEKLKTQSQMRKFCLEHFLSYRRMVEWRDIYNQIIEILSTDKKPGKKHLKLDINQGVYDKIHRCILSGYLSNIAQKKEKNFYQAAKSREVMIFPGSGLFNKGGNWIFAAEITQTSRLFARTVANIKSEWLEELGKDNCRHTYSAAHWEKNRGQVVASEKVTLFGLTIVEKRSVAYDKINAEAARDIFIREALLTGEVPRPLPFLQHNLEMWEKARTAEEKLRKRGFAADEDAVARLYEQRLPVLSDIRSLLKFIKDKGGDSFLRFSEEDFIVLQPDASEIAQYPDKIKIGEASLTSQYRFSPGKNDDGVTVKVPLGLVKSAAATDIDSHLPGLLREKIIHLLKTLPKSLRLKLPAPAKIAVSFLERKTAAANPLPQALSHFIRDKFGIVVPLESWNLQTVPSYLNVRYSVINEDGKEIKTSRDLNELNQELSDKINIGALEKLRPQWEKEGITGWDFGDLPDKIPLQGNYGLVGYAYPALVSREESVDLSLFTDEKESVSSHLSGCRTLYCLHFADKIKQLKKQIAFSNELKALAAKIGNSKALEQSTLNKVILDLFSVTPRNNADYTKHADSVKARILTQGQVVLDAVKSVLTAFAETSDYLKKLTLKNTKNTPALKLIDDIKNELQRLVPPDFPEKYPSFRLREIPRYLKAASIRAERGCLNLAAAEKKGQDVDIYNRKWEELRAAVLPYASEEKKNRIDEFAWMIEEYKVSLFAQELKTPYPVSPKKLNQLIKDIENS